MTTDSAHTRSWQVFEVVFGIPFLLALALHRIVPLALPQGDLARIVTAGGAALIIVGLTLVVCVRRAFSQRGQPTDPGHPTSKLVTVGVFSVSRNPLYIGGICVLVGLALTLDLAWFLVLLLPALVLCHSVLIAPEERYLTAKFGAEYVQYSASACRWLGRTRNAE